VVSETVELKTSQKGTLWASFTAIVGGGDAGTFVRVSIFGDVGQKLACNIARGSKVYIEGSLRLNEYTSGEGEKRTGLQIAASKCEVLGIGHNKPRRSRNGPQDRRGNGQGDRAETPHTDARRDYARPLATGGVGDELIPFAAEVR
jgi:single-stranded DNA-binding protein